MAQIPCGAFIHAPPLGSNDSVWDVPSLRLPASLTPQTAGASHASSVWWATVPADAVAGPFVDSRGCEFRQLFQSFPWLAPLYFAAEARFNALPYVRLAEQHMTTAFLVCAAYLLFCILGQRLMQSRKAFDLRGPLIAWNLLLSVFSLAAFVRTAPHVLHTIASKGLYDSICAPAEPSYGHGAVGLWTCLFIYSKFPELLDTVFIVLRKKKLIFLHWYHHVTVLLFCFHAYATRSSAGLYFTAMNTGVHALMYFYYALTAMRYRLKWDFVVTVAQISQMVVGVAVCVAVALYWRVGAHCDVAESNFTAAIIMYASYFALFVVFAVERYIVGGPAAGKAKDE